MTIGRGLRQSRSRVPNRCFVGTSAAVLLCPNPSGKLVSVTIDLEQLERVRKAGFWRVANFYPKGFRLYAYCTLGPEYGRKVIYLHRFITEAPAGKVVDHLNHRGTDNRSANLRVVTHRENLTNYSPAARERFAAEGRRRRKVSA